MEDEINEEETDDSINVQSKRFNPLQALYSRRMIIPYPAAPVLDNIAKANSLLSRNINLYDKTATTAKKKKNVEMPSTSKEVNEDVSDSLRKKGPAKNVVTYMSEAKGPLAFLRACLEKRIRIKVWTRGAREIRGYCIGFVAAFDKHWNLALQDVQEKWTRKVKRKTVHIGEANELPLGWKAMGPMVTPPKIKVTKSDKKKEICERHVNQMLIRGEQIAFISVSGP